MSDYKGSILARFGVGVFEASFDEMAAQKKVKLPPDLVGVTLHVRKLSPKVYEKFLFTRMDSKTRELDFSKYPGMRAELLALALCDPDGNALFESTDDANANVTNEFSKWAFDLCQWVNGADAGAQEEAEKN